MRGRSEGVDGTDGRALPWLEPLPVERSELSALERCLRLAMPVRSAEGSALDATSLAGALSPSTGRRRGLLGLERWMPFENAGEAESEAAWLLLREGGRRPPP